MRGKIYISWLRVYTSVFLLKGGNPFLATNLLESEPGHLSMLQLKMKFKLELKVDFDKVNFEFWLKSIQNHDSCTPALSCLASNQLY